MHVKQNENLGKYCFMATLFNIKAALILFLDLDGFFITMFFITASNKLNRVLSFLGLSGSSTRTIFSPAYTEHHTNDNRHPKLDKSSMNSQKF